MRKLMALAIVLTLAGVGRSWALVGLGDIKFDGSLEVSGNSANNETDLNSDTDHRGNTATRVRLGMGAGVTEGVNGRVELVRTPRLYDADAPTNVAGEEGLWEVQNAYIEMEDLLGFGVKLGRQYVGNPGDLVWNIGPRMDDSLSVNAAEGILLSKKWSKVNVDLFTGKADNVGAIDAADGNGEINVSNLDVVLPSVIPDGNLRLGWVLGEDKGDNDGSVGSASDTDSLSIMRVGVNGSLKDNMLTYRAEFLKNSGSARAPGADVDHKGSAIDVGVGLNPKETKLGALGIWGNFARSSGDDNTGATTDDKAFRDLSYFGLNASDRVYGEIFGKSNTLSGGIPAGQGLGNINEGVAAGGLQVINVGVSLKPAKLDKTTIKLDWYNFARVEDKINNVDAGDDFGTEYDLTVAYDHSDNVKIEAGYALLVADKALQAEVVGNLNDPDEDVSKLFARLCVKWGGEQ